MRWASSLSVRLSVRKLDEICELNDFTGDWGQLSKTLYFIFKYRKWPIVNNFIHIRPNIQRIWVQGRKTLMTMCVNVHTLGTYDSRRKWPASGLRCSAVQRRSTTRIRLALNLVFAYTNLMSHVRFYTSRRRPPIAKKLDLRCHLRPAIHPSIENMLN